ncbi:gamma carbonic anhydrase family protein [Oryzobacter telluris]|uniref:gamma carbonic anhydrase family protein n=1 Tax=Oryzobacter telluris TaxID=3149179 RepID=UPI00370D0EEF
MRISLPSGSPRVAASAWVAADANLIGPVTIGEDASVWFGVTVRADGDRIDIGERSNVQDGAVLHTDPGHPLELGRDVSVGHRAVLHGCVIGDGVLVGMGAVVLNGARVGAGALVGAGAVVLEGTEVAPGAVVVGVPGRVRDGAPGQRVANEANAAAYVRLAAGMRTATGDGEGKACAP